MKLNYKFSISVTFIIFYDKYFHLREYNLKIEAVNFNKVDVAMRVPHFIELSL